MKFDTILKFWFEELTPKDHFAGSEKVDQLIRERFSAIHKQASHGEFWKWRTEPHGRLAEVIILDQFSRNIYRGAPQAFAQDEMALVLAQEAIASGADEKLATDQKSFLYMPYMHSESPLIHEEAVKLFSKKGLENGLDYEIKHKKIIDRFGRYPHRNKILGRPSTPEEIEFLKQPGSGF